MAFYQNQLIARKTRIKTGNAPKITRVYIYTLEDVLAPIFRDKELTTPLENPVITDSRGYFDFNIECGTYKLVIGNPKIKEITVSISDTSDLGIGVNVLSNAPLNSNFLDRIDGTELIANCPNLAGTPGYPINVSPAGIEYDSEFISSEIASSESTYLKNALTDSNGRMYMSLVDDDINPGSFLYSDDNGATEQYAPIVNTSGKKYVAENGLYVLAAGVSGNISVYNYSNLAYITTNTAGTLDINYVEYDPINFVWVAASRVGKIYTSSDPTSGWVLFGTISGISGSLNYYEPTGNGYIIFDDIANEIRYLNSFLNSPIATTVITGLGSNAMFNKCANMDSGKVLISTQGGSGRQFHLSEDSGQSFVQVPGTGNNPNNMSDIIHIGNDVWVILSDFGASIQYTTDLGNTFNNVSYTVPSGAGGGNRMWLDQSGNLITFYKTNKAQRVKFNALTIPPTTFNIKALASPNLTDTYKVKCN